MIHEHALLVLCGATDSKQAAANSAAVAAVYGPLVVLRATATERGKVSAALRRLWLSGCSGEGGFGRPCWYIGPVCRYVADQYSTNNRYLTRRHMAALPEVAEVRVGLGQCSIYRLQCGDAVQKPRRQWWTIMLAISMVALP
jgi:hypothetical protein